MFTINDGRKKLYSDEPLSNVFDGPATGRALSMRYSCNYPGSIVDQLRSSRVSKSFGTSPMRTDIERLIAEASSEAVSPSGDRSDSSSSSDTDNNGDYRLQDIRLIPDTRDSAVIGNNVGENPNCTVIDTKACNLSAPQAEEAVVRRQKETKPLSSTDSDSDQETSVSGYVCKNKTPHTKSRKRRKKLTSNLSATRYDVGKQCPHVFMLLYNK